MSEYALITLNMIKYGGIYPKNSVEYARIILNVPDAVHSIRSMYNLLSNYQDRCIQRSQTFKMEHFPKRIMPECRCARRIFAGQGGGVELGTSISISSKTQAKEAPQGNTLDLFSPRYFWNYILNGKFNQTMGTVRAFLPRSGHVFWFSKRAGATSLLLPRCTPVSMAEYAWISLNIPKYPSKYLNKLFWLWRGSQYAWSSYMIERLLKMMI